jgi:hypothetical protein
MKIKKEYIGSKCWSKLLSRWLIIEESKSDFYWKAGILYIYETTAPKLIKYVDNTKKRNNATNSDGDGIDNDSESKLLI